ncbi:similar to Saccharomyces cerevisiae YDR465C RMT2 Arginine N5 methyltransferase [Maudiozyma barnettii]|uniref:Arginine N-methyltransferase 2 n=1 Tax=Maudiozyma barnettii TaxID=61262 RepID=A0A8H2VI66_9SACH|nr:uncharacterized protein KABA2_08S00836 [Kazachstania barnettii]CAB4255995.1 similar to Saccharomyces cerevisiae YDR465C RMT2 Arginine N5 methyltransferase [Kazachstania barnettii]CAD1784603.1 similar to Saccharomyces cerevisiae YDR465C RMT2 Arginine N5 methyltransferase [Kazachstania barnettii]
MSDLHHLLTFPTRPITSDVYETQLAHLLKSGIPPTYTLEQVAAFEQGKEDEDDDGSESSNTTPLHILARSLPRDATKEELNVVLNLMNTLFEYGAGWNFLDYENKSIGDLLLEAGQYRNSALYQRVIEAGVSAELLLRKVNGGDVEFLDDLEGIEQEQEIQTKLVDDSSVPEISDSIDASDSDLTAADPMTYLNTKLEYTDDKLITKDNKDGVMMDWEDGIMKLAAETLFSDSSNTINSTVLNIGFGMGIIDTYIQEKNPAHHYICEAHPDVLAKMKKDGWYEKPNVTILEGRWQNTLNKLLDDGNVFFDGIYYDTFSEHYEDMLNLYDIIVGLIKPEGVFSFFNGLGADRPICYDVYKRIVEMDVNNYGMKCEYTTVQIGKQLPDWSDVKRSYYNCDYYYHPRISFM